MPCQACSTALAAVLLVQRPHHLGGQFRVADLERHLAGHRQVATDDAHRVGYRNLGLRLPQPAFPLSYN